MSSEDLKRVQGHINKALKNTRSKNEITSTFKAAGIIDEDGNLRSTYKDLFIPEK